MKLDYQGIQLLNIFETFTKASVKDCFLEENKIVFIVNNGHMSKAIGPKGKNIRRLEGILKKRIKVVEFNNDILKFIKSCIAPIKINEIEMKDDEVLIRAEDSYQKGILIGRNKKNLNSLKEIVNKYFKVKNIKIL
ncbi:MAG: NusA-like transcription termination signal-binding factor [Nanoarchaeota archaeon]